MSQIEKSTDSTQDIWSRIGKTADDTTTSEATETSKTTDAQAPLRPKHWYETTQSQSTDTGDGKIYNRLASQPKPPAPEDTNGMSDKTATPPSTNDEAPPLTESQDYESQVGSSIQQSIDKLNLAPDQTKAMVAKLTFAMHHPELADADTLKMLKEITQGLNLPADWSPDNSTYDDQISQKLDISYGNLVDNLVDSDGNPVDPKLKSYIEAKTAGMSDDQKSDFINSTLKSLKALHYHPDMNVNNGSELKDLAASLEKQALGGVFTQFGIPSNTQGYPKPASDVFDETVRNDYRYNVEQGISEYSSLSSDDQTLLRKFLNGEITDVPQAIKDAAENIKAAALAKTQQEYGFPSDWAPAGVEKSTWTGSQTLLSGMMQSEAMYKTAKTLISNSNFDPDSKILMFNYLKLVGEAINKMKEMIHQIQAADALKGRDYSTALSDSMKVKYDQQQKAMDEQKQKMQEMQAKQQKMAPLNKALKIIAPIMIAISVVMICTGVLGPLGAAVMAASVTLMALDQAGVTVNGKSLTATIFSPSGIGAPFKLIPGVSDELATTLGVVASLVILAAIASVTGGVGSSSAMVAYSQIIMTSNLGSHVALAAGASTQVAMYIGIAVGVVAMFVSMKVASTGSSENTFIADQVAEKCAETAKQIQNIGQQITTSVLTTGQELALRLQRFILEIKLVLLNGVSAALRDGTQALEKLTSVIQLTSAGMETHNAIYQFSIDRLQADIEWIKANAEAQTTKSDQVIEKLQEMIQILQKIMDSLLAMLKSGEALQKKKFQDVNIEWPA